MTYERVQKSSSWIPQPAKKKSHFKSHFAPQPFTVQTKRGKTDKSPAPAYAPVADDWVTNNPLMRSIQTTENKEVQALQRQEESEGKDDLQMSSQEGTIQRQCDSCDSQVSSEQEKQPIQAKLSLGQPGDKYEQEADAVARQVVNKISTPPTQPSVQRQSQSGGTSQLNITLMRHSEGGVGGGSSVTPEVEQNIQQSRGSGQPLDASVREPMQQAFGTDFSGVKIHTNSQSDQLNRSLSARAFTTGSDIFFKQGEYNPGSRDGQELLAHELTHVVQQMGTVQASGFTIQHKVETMGGEWDTNKYEVINNGSKDIGVDIDLKFSPKEPVDATKIGLTQMVNSINNGSVVALNDTVRDRSIPANEAGEGSHIDQLEQYKNPLYATGAASSTDTLASTPTVNSWGQHGWHYQDASGNLQKEDAHLKDGPQLPNRGSNASQIFESAALAIEGNQEGTYYGSVKWGWQTDGKGNFTKLPLSVESQGNPTYTFMRSAQLWNDNPTSKGEDTINLPTTLEPGDAVQLTTQQLITTLKQAKTDLANITEEPGKTNKDFEVRRLEAELQRRQIIVSVTAVSASGDNWLAGDDDVYVKLSCSGRSTMTSVHPMNDGDSYDFQLSLSPLLPLDSSVTIEVYDEDTFLTGADDLLATMLWNTPFDEASSDNGDYQMNIRFKK